MFQNDVDIIIRVFARFDDFGASLCSGLWLDCKTKRGLLRPQIFSAPVRPRPVGRFTADTNTNGAKVHARFGV